MRPPGEDPEHEELAGLLDRAAVEERGILEQALREAGEADRAMMERALERAAAAAPRPIRAQRKWGALVALAAVGLLLWLGLRGGGAGDDGPTGVVLGDRDLRIVSPLGPGTTYGTIEWEFPITAAITYEVHVRDAATGEPLLEARVQGRRSLAPEPAAAAAWPDRIRIELRAIDEDGAVLASCSASASRSP